MELSELTKLIDSAEKCLRDNLFDISKSNRMCENRYKIHPIIRNRNSYLDLLKHTDGNRLINYNFDSYDYIEFCGVLNSCVALNGLEDIIRDLKTKESYYNAYYELIIGSLYLSKNYPIKKVEVRDNIKTCDFEITIHEDMVYVECKNLEDWNSAESVLWEKLYDQFENLTKKINRYLTITIISDEKVNGSITNQIFEHIKSFAKTCTEEFQKNITDRNTLIIKESKDYIIYTDLNPVEYAKQCGKDIIKKDNQMWCEQSVTQLTKDTDQQKALLITNENKVTIIKDREIDYRKKIIGQIKKARKQLPHNEPGLIYINLPTRKGEDYLSAIDNTYEYVFNEINRNSSRIHSVILTSRIYQGGDQNDAVDFRSYIVPNYNCKYVLPEDFVIHTERTEEALDLDDQQEEGSFEFTYIVGAKWNKLCSISLLNKIDNHGRFQFHVWKTWDQKVRFEIVRQKYGRLLIESDDININFDDELKVKGIWNTGRIGLGINGKTYRSQGYTI